ncbi:MAG TPA: GvpL/GvpF family gas vesicle protein [Thermoanaerobaculia bacterium]|nr:GvpL/GvpF family gas vesicle protein [Thermoanaerobaculia bacterium]
MIYLYALVDEEPSGPLDAGIADEPLRVLPQGKLAAVTGEIPDRPRPDRETLERQDAVVRRLAGLFGAILPARFGEVFADEAALTHRLAPREREVSEALSLVRGCVQMTLRVFGDPELISEPEAAPAGGPGTRYLAARRREIERSHSLPEIEPLREALRPLLRAERIERHEAAGPLLGTAYHLILRGEAGAYLSTLEAAQGRIGGRRVAATGPWPPYAFAPEAAP